MAYGSSPYTIQSDDPQDLIRELDRILALISDRLDRLEGFRGMPQIKNSLITNGDLVNINPNTGLVLNDNGNPPTFWRITIDSNGTVYRTQIGRTYYAKDDLQVVT